MVHWNETQNIYDFLKLPSAPLRSIITSPNLICEIGTGQHQRDLSSPLENFACYIRKSPGTLLEGKKVPPQNAFSKVDLPGTHQRFHITGSTFCYKALFHVDRERRQAGSLWTSSLQNSRKDVRCCIFIEDSLKDLSRTSFGTRSVRVTIMRGKTKNFPIYARKLSRRGSDRLDALWFLGRLRQRQSTKIRRP